MVQLIAWVAVLYLVLKAVQWTSRPRGGYAEAPPGWRTDLKRGEPWLLLGAVLLPSAIFFYGQWWHHRWASRGFAHAADCVGQLATLQRLPGVYRTVRRADVSESILTYYSLAIDQGGQMGRDRASVWRALDGRKLAYARRYDTMVRTGDRRAIEAAIGAIDRCVRDDWAHDGLLNP